MAPERFMVLDGNSLVHRAFHAIRSLSTSQGMPTNAVYGFTTMLLKLLEAENPDFIAVTFDKSRATFRQERFADYKAHRAPTPEDLRAQFPLVKRLLAALRIPVFEAEGYEADDIIATLAKSAEDRGMVTTIVTGDRDTLQLVSEHIRVMLTRKGISDMEAYDLSRFDQRYPGLAPLQLGDLKALTGDPSDNIPGVPSVGEKTALKLVQEFGSVDNIVQRLAEVKPEKLRTTLESNREQLLTSRWLVKLVEDVPVAIDWEQCRHPQPDYPQLLEVFRELEFRSLVAKFRERMPAPEALNKNPQGEKAEPEYTFRRLSAVGDLEQLLANVDGEVAAVYIEPVAVSTQRRRLRLAISVRNGLAGSLEMNSDQEVPPVWPEISAWLAAGAGKMFFDAKAGLLHLRRWGVELDGIVGDVMLEAYLDNPSLPKMGLEDLSHQLLKQVIETAADSSEGLCRRAEAVRQLRNYFQPRLREADLDDLYREVELPLLGVLADMEWSGIKVDVAQLNAMSIELAQQLMELQGRIYALAGEEFNINSTRQLASVLFDKLGLPVVKKTKTGFSTDAEVLEQLAPQHAIVALILEHRQIVKLKSTYVDGLRAQINPETGKLHTTFNQGVTATGRLSSTEPNLQNIPIRLEAGRRLRRVFVPAEPGWLILSADYSQIDLRVLAHISGDRELVAAFCENRDIHTHTAAEVFGVSEEMVTKEMRRQAKVVNFGIIYGMSDFGLAGTLGISRAEAKQYIDRYLLTYEGVHQFMQDIVETARAQGYVTTLLNRRRYIPELKSPSRTVRSFGERVALNTPVQGTSSDIIKLAMLRVDRKIRELGLQSRMLLQVHDELIFETPEGELSRLADMVREEMEHAVSLRVPLTVDVEAGPNWYELLPLARKGRRG